jgi:hypothetical protein
MSDGIRSIRISLLLADGKHFPVFYFGDPDTRTLSLVPAVRGQNEADIRFFAHSPGGSAPTPLGVLRFPDLPTDSPDLELSLEASLDESGFLKVVVNHPESGRSESLAVSVPDITGDSPMPPDVIHPRRRGRTLLGIAFVLAGLALVLWLTLAVTSRGRQEAPPPPLSGTVREMRTV